MTRQDNMVVADRTGQEIAGIGRLQLQRHLRAAEVLLILVVLQLPFCHKKAVQLAGDLEHGHLALRQFAVDAHALPLSTSMRAGLAWKPVFPVSA